VIGKTSSSGVEDLSAYFPYGERTYGARPVSDLWAFVGSLGYRRFDDTLYDVWNRWLETNAGHWKSLDPLWPDELPYMYVAGMPHATVDPSGLACTNSAMKGLLSCSFRKEKIFKHKKTRTYKEARGCDKCQCPGPLKCYISAQVNTVQKGYSVATMKISSFSIEGDCGIVGNFLLHKAKGVLSDIYVDILKSLFGGQKGVAQKGWYIDCTGVANLWIAIFECGPQYCDGYSNASCRPSYPPPEPGPPMPGAQIRGGGSPIWN